MEGQTPPTQVVLAQTSPSLTMILFPAPRVRLSPIVLPVQLPRKPLPHPEFLLAAAYKAEPNLESRLPIEECSDTFPDGIELSGSPFVARATAGCG